MTPYRVNWFTAIFLAIFFTAVLGYAFFEARNIVYGPEIDIGELEHASARVSEQLIAVRGRAENIQELRMNGRVVPTTEDGAFEEVHLLAPGYNAIVLSASDKVGRTTRQVIEVVYQPQERAPEPVINMTTDPSEE